MSLKLSLSIMFMLSLKMTQLLTQLFFGLTVVQAAPLSLDSSRSMDHGSLMILRPKSRKTHIHGIKTPVLCT